MQLLIAYSVNVLLIVTAFSELAQFFPCFLQMIVVYTMFITNNHASLHLKYEENLLKNEKSQNIMTMIADFFHDQLCLKSTEMLKNICLKSKL